MRFTINMDGTHTGYDNLGMKSGGTCLTSGAMVNQKLTLRGDTPAFTTLNHQPQVPATVSSFDPAKTSKGVVVVGRLYGQLMPIFIRVSAANSSLTADPPVADDESGISIMTPAGSIT